MAKITLCELINSAHNSKYEYIEWQCDNINHKKNKNSMNFFERESSNFISKNHPMIEPPTEIAPVY